MNADDRSPPGPTRPLAPDLRRAVREPRPADERGLNKSQKFVRLLEEMQGPGGVTAGEVMARFDLDDRTLRRYLADLRELGLPVQADGRSHTRRLWVDASYRRTGVQLSLLELVSLRFGRALFDFLDGTGFAADMDDALETLSTLAVGPGAEHAHDLDRKFLAVPEHRKDHSRDADLLEDILTALLYQNPVRAHYQRIGGPTRAYSLYPYTLATYRQGLYLFAFDVEEGKIKTFAVDRFRNFERTRGEHFPYPDDYDPAALVADSFGIIGGAKEEVCLRFNRRVSPYILERVWHPSQALEPEADGSVLLRMHVGASPELVGWVMSFGPDCRVQSPPSLVEQIRRLHREAAEGVDPLERR